MAVRTLLTLVCLALSACAAPGRKLAELPEPVSSLHIAVNETPMRTAGTLPDPMMSAYMMRIEQVIAGTFAASNVQVTTSALKPVMPTNAGYALLLSPSSARSMRGTLAVRIIYVDAVLMHIRSRTPVWSYVLEVDGNPQRFSRESVQALADEMLKQNIIAPASGNPAKP